MEEKKLDIQALISASNKKNQVTYKLRKILPEIETAIENGVSYNAIVQALSDQNIARITVATFRTTLHRIRKKLKPPQPNETGAKKYDQVSISTSTPQVSPNESTSDFQAGNTIKSFQQIKDENPGMSIGTLRDKHSAQFFDNYMNPHIRALLNKK